jgi:predicted acyl esterase
LPIRFSACYKGMRMRRRGSRWVLHRSPCADVSQLVRGEPFRGKFRHSFEKPEAFTPGKVEEIDATFQDVNHTFRRGHRIMVQVQSSWFPLTDRNPQTSSIFPTPSPRTS